MELPVKLRISQTVSSADAHLNDRVEFEVLEDIHVGGALVIPKGGIPWVTIKGAQPKHRMGRGEKLEIVMDSVRLVDGEKAALRATKEVQGGGHVGAMTAGIVVTGLILWPAAPFFLFMRGKDITIAKGTEVPTFVSGNFALNMAKFRPEALQAVTQGQTSTNSDADSAECPTPRSSLDETWLKLCEGGKLRTEKCVSIGATGRQMQRNSTIADAGGRAQENHTVVGRFVEEALPCIDLIATIF